MGLADNLGASLGRVVGTLLGGLGSTVTILRRDPDATSGDGASVDRYVPLAAGDGVPMFISALSVQRFTYAWGSPAGANAEGVVASTVGDLVAGDGIEVTLGAFLGERFLVVAVRPEPRGGLVQVALARTLKEFPR